MDAFGIVSRMQTNRYNWLGVPLTFKHPKTRQSASLTAIYDTKPHETSGMSVKIVTERPQYRVRLADLTALNLAPTDLDGLSVTVDGKTWQVSSSSAIPAHVSTAAEIGLNLIMPK